MDTWGTEVEVNEDFYNRWLKLEEELHQFQIKFAEMYEQARRAQLLKDSIEKGR